MSPTNVYSDLKYCKHQNKMYLSLNPFVLFYLNKEIYIHIFFRTV